MKSVSGYMIGIMRDSAAKCRTEKSFFPIHWKTISQQTQQNSSMASELTSMKHCLAQMLHIARFLKELGHELPKCFFIDAKDVIDGLRSENKPKDLFLMPDLDFIRTHMMTNEVTMAHIPREFQIADELTAPRSCSMISGLVSKEKSSLISFPEQAEYVDLSIKEISTAKNYQFQIPYGPPKQPEVTQMPSRHRQVTQNNWKEAMATLFNTDKPRLRLDECHKPLFLDMFCGIKSSHPPLKRFFREVSMDIDIAYQATFTVDARSWDIASDYQ